jgi:PAS domain S-box-containing protein
MSHTETLLSNLAQPSPEALQQADADAIKKQLEQALIRFDLVNQSASDGLWDMEYPADGQIGPQTPFWWSDQFRKLLGYSDETDFPNVLDSWGSLLHPNDAEVTFAAFSAHLLDKTGRTPYDRVYQLKCKNGEYRWFRARGTTLRDKDGNPLRVAGSLTDITEERRKAAELQAALTRFDLVNQSASDGLWDMEYPADGQIGPQTPFWWSDQFRKLLGYADETDFPNVLDSWGSLLHPNDAEITFAAFSAHLLDKTGRTPYDRVYQLKCKNGEYRWFRARGTTLRDKDGNPLRVAGSLTDITEERRKAAELQAALTRFDLVNQSASDGLWDMEYPADGQIGPQTPFWWSDQFRKLLGYADETDFPNVLDSWGSLLHPNDAEITFAAFSAHLLDKTGRTPYDRVYQLKCKNGEYRWFRARGTTLRDKDGNPLRVAGSLTDITEERRKAAELQAALTRFDLVNQSASDGLWDMEYPADGQIGPQTPFWWSDQFRKLLGYTDETDFPNVLDSWGSLLHPNDAEVTFAAFSAHLLDKTGRTPYDRVYQLKCKNGEYRWFRARGTTLRDKDGNPLRVAGSLTDIHDEKIRTQKLDDSIGTLVRALNERTRAIFERTQAVAAGSQTLCATTEEMNASVEELTASIHSIARNASNTDAVARSTQDEAEQGASSIHKAIESMEGLRQSSEDMSEIIKVISEIASQTNLLAFNAAIEAARAGEHGLGFSVVADEVRKLAERSAQATKEISKLINASVKQIVQGSDVARQAGDAFGKIVQGIRQTGQAIAEVKASAEEQMSAARTIGDAVQTVAERVEASVTAADGISGACSDLDAEAKRLQAAYTEFSQKS